MAKKREIGLEELLRESALYENPLTDKQADILRAAESLFADQGFSDTPTAQIAKVAGVTERTLFKHFPTKADLLRRVVFPLLLRFVVPSQINHLKSLIKSAGPDVDGIFKALFHDRLSMASLHGGRIKLVLSELLRNEDLRNQVSKLWLDQLWSEVMIQIRSLQKSGKVRSDVRAETIGRTMISMIVMYVVSNHLFPAKRDHDRAVEEFSSILMNGIRPGRASG